MKRFKIGDRVMTPHGIGTIIAKGLPSRIDYRMLVKLDVNPYPYGNGELAYGTHNLTKLPTINPKEDAK
jgi:hypothetical protein